VSGEPFLDRVTGSRFLRFGIVGAGGFVVDFSIVSLLFYEAGVSYALARAVSIFAAMNFTWLGNRVLTFREHAATEPGMILREWFWFLVTNAIGAFVNLAVSSGLKALVPNHMVYFVGATLAGVAAGLVFNFTLSRKFVFREPPVL
jgi:putative flippase GtrA